MLPDYDGAISPSQFCRGRPPSRNGPKNFGGEEKLAPCVIIGERAAEMLASERRLSALSSDGAFG